MKKPAIIVAMDKNRLIGRDNSLPWKLPADLKNFKILTTGHKVIMGRKTYESIGKPLPNRTNIIISRKQIDIPGCIVIDSPQEALNLISDDEIAFVIGGAEIYRQLLLVCQYLFITLVHEEFSGNVYFPEIRWDDWEIIEHKEFKSDEKNPHDYSFSIYKRNNFTTRK